MNEIRSFLIQVYSKPNPNITYRSDWEVKLAKGNDGKYYGYAQETQRAHKRTHGWIATDEEDIQKAYEKMKQFCERNTG
jgi:hypothetical protein